MANPFVKAWKYLMASLGARLDEHADPKVQIQQAIEEARRQHQALTTQAAAVIANRRKLEMELNRQMSEVEKLGASARQALVLADKARAGGDEKKAAQYEQSAQAFATELVTAEQSMQGLKILHDQALAATAQAKQAVEDNAWLLKQKSAEGTKLLSQLEQAKMQEQVADSLQSMSALQAPSTTPSLDEVREKIERRYATALGRAELAESSVEGRMLEVQKSTLDMAGESRLEKIRASLAAGEEAAGASPSALSTGPESAPALDQPATERRRDPDTPPG